MPRAQKTSNEPGEVVAQLVEDMAVLKQELQNERWKKVFENFSAIQGNFENVHARLRALELRVNAGRDE